MYVIEVMPLIRGNRKETLTYYSSTTYDAGSILSVPVREKTMRALVLGTKSVSAAKTAVRAATFTLRKLPEQKVLRPLPPVILETAKQLLKQIPATLGSILFSMLPEELLSGQFELDSNLPCVGIYETPFVSLLQATKEERLRTYRSRIREAFAHRGSVLLLAPSSAHIEKLVEELGSGIDERLVTFSPTLTKKKIEKSFEAFHDLSQAKLVIATPGYAFLDRHDITHVIIENCRSPFYKAKVRPYLDVRVGLEVMAKLSGRQLILGDLLPRSEDEHKRRTEIYQTEGEHLMRIAFPSKVKVIKQHDRPKPDLPFKLLSLTLLKRMELAIAKKERVFLFAARRGLSPVVVCVDCGHIFRCPDSGTPYSLLKTIKDGNEERWFLSSTSGKRVRAAHVCPECGSWRLKEKGVGIQHIYDELLEHFERDRVTIFDHTTATTKRKAESLIGDFYAKRGNFLLATSMVIPYLEEPVDVTVITSADAARTIPSWRSEEEFFSLCLSLREISKDSLIIQTRQESDTLLEYIKSGTVDQFYSEEISLRQSLKYPPFFVFIHLAITGKEDSLVAYEAEIKKRLEQYEPKFYSSPHSTKNKAFRYGLIRIPRTNWPNAELIDLLRELPPFVRIEIDPDRIV